MEEVETPRDDRKPGARAVRLFISSTFKDFNAERSLLVKRILPELRRRCRARRIVINEIDLRWGVPTDQPSLAVCLKELDRCQPFFVGMLGDYYGSRTSEQDLELLPDPIRSNLFNLAGRSFTEIEVEHVLNNRSRFPYACFYLKDSGDQTEPGSQSEEDQKAQQDLKDRVREACTGNGSSIASTDSAWKLTDNIANSEELCGRVLHDIWERIEALFQIDETEEVLSPSFIEHEAYLDSRLTSYVAIPSNLQRLDSHHHSKDGGPLVLLGDPGTGKSSLLAAWIKGLRKLGSTERPRIFFHFVGVESSVANASLASVLQRLFESLQGWNILSGTAIPSKTSELVSALPAWLDAWSGSGGGVLIVDGVNQLIEPSARSLSWFPNLVPSNITVVLSSTHLASTRFAGEQDSNFVFEMPEAEPSIRVEITKVYLRDRGKIFDEKRLERLTESPQCGNPLFLRLLLMRLCVAAERSDIDRKLDNYLRSEDVHSLFCTILEELENDQDLITNPSFPEDRSLIVVILCLLHSSKRPLDEVELRGLLGAFCVGGQQDDTTLAPQTWVSMATEVLDELLIWNNGRLTFYHQSLRDAVRDTFLTNSQWADFVKSRFSELAMDWKVHRNDAALQEYTVEFGPWHLIDYGKREALVGADSEHLLCIEFIILSAEFGKIDNLSAIFSALETKAETDSELRNEKNCSVYVDSLKSGAGIATDHIDRTIALNIEAKTHEPTNTEFTVIADFVRLNRAKIAHYPKAVAQMAFNWTEDWNLGKKAKSILDRGQEPWFRRLDIPNRQPRVISTYPPLQLGESLRCGFDITADGTVGIFQMFGDRGESDRIEVWNLKRGEQIALLPFSGGRLAEKHDSIALRNGTSQFITIADGGDLYLGDYDDRTMHKMGSKASSVKISLDGTFAFVGYRGGKLVILELDEMKVWQAYQIFEGARIDRISVSPTGHGALIAGAVRGANVGGLAVIDTIAKSVLPVSIEDQASTFESIASDENGKSYIAAEFRYHEGGPRWRMWYISKGEALNLGDADNHVFSVTLSGGGRLGFLTTVAGYIGLVEFTAEGPRMVVAGHEPMGIQACKIRLDASRIYYVTTSGEYRTKAITQLLSKADSESADTQIWLAAAINDKGTCTLQDNLGRGFELDLMKPKEQPWPIPGPSKLAVVPGKWRGKNFTRARRKGHGDQVCSGLQSEEFTGPHH